MTDTTEEQKETFEILNEDTVRTMDYILRGLELGKFDDTANKVEFLGKLSGENEPKYIATLLKRINDLEFENRELRVDIDSSLNRIIQLEQDKIETEAKLSNIDSDMQTVAKAIRQLFEPKPLKNSWELDQIDTFCNNNGAGGF